MSHSKERAEKNCLNCGETVQGRYCQVCGQENIEPKESFWGLVSHFFQDITHFDGKFFSTGKLLLTKPGFLPKEYLSGRRARYLHPIRMYVFTSALFFLIFYSVFNVRNLGLGKKRLDKQQTVALADAKARSLKTAHNKEDSANIEKTFRMIERLPIDVTINDNDITAENDETDKYDESDNNNDTDKSNETDRNKEADQNNETNRNNEDDKKGESDKNHKRDSNVSVGLTDTLKKKDTSLAKTRIYRYNSSDTTSQSSNLRATNDSPGVSKKSISKSRSGRDRDDFGLLDVSKAFMSAYDSRAEYDSAQAALPSEARDGWLKRRFAYQNITFKQRYGDNEGELIQDLLDKFIHTFPYLLFISLPLYAIFLKLLYIRRKKFFYADHGLFLIYLYIFTFLHLLVFFGLRELHQHWDYWWLGLIMFIFVMYGIYYAYKSMRKFYEQGRGKTILKFLILNFMAFTTISFLFVLFFFIALLRL